MLRRPRISVIGAGATGSTVAQLLAQRELGDVVLVDVVEGMPQGKALDLQEACPLFRSSSRVVGTNGYAETEGSDVLVITAGLPRKPGMSREDLLKTNYSIVRDVVRAAVPLSPEAVVVVLTNPLDVMAYAAWRVSGLPPHRVVGQSGILDSARFRWFLAEALGISVEDVSALVLGGHGDSMVPLVRYSYAGGVPIERLLSRETIEKIVERTRFGGGEIVSLMGTSAFYAPAAAVVEMVEAVVKDKRRVLPCSAYLDGQYGQKDVFAGVPVVLGGGGVERVIELDLLPAEEELFARSCADVRRQISLLPEEELCAGSR